MFCCKTVKNNVICKLHFFSDVNIDKFRLYFFINPHFFFLLELVVKWPPLGHVEESQST